MNVHVLDASAWRGIWQDMRRMPIDLLPARERMDEALALAVTHDLSVYDALYLAVTLHLGGVMHTADATLHAAAVAAGVHPRQD